LSIPDQALAESSWLIDKLAAQELHLTNEIMPNDPLARTRPPTEIVEADYQAFCAALSESARGRDFLAEFTRRNRHADTELVLAALDRLQTQVRVQIAAPQADRVRQELRALLAAIRTTRPETDDSSAAVRAAKQAALLGFIEHRIAVIIAPAREQSILPDEVAALVMPERAAVAARSALAVVPVPDEPELPIPAPAAAQPLPAMSLVHAPESKFAVTFIEGARPDPVVAEVFVAKPEVIETIVFAPISPPDRIAAQFDAPAPRAAAALPPVNPLAAIMALSEAERLALFT
jgi:hypothetical protein